jgi:DnaJ-class molecular chaperone
MSEDYYKTLGIDREASPADVQKAYRRLAQKYHPDRNPDDQTAKSKFQAIQKAYDVLNDPQKRAAYDRYGADFDASAQGPRSTTWRSGGATPFEDFDFGQFFHQDFGDQPHGLGDFFRQFTQRGAGRRKPNAQRATRGRDVRHETTIPFQTAVLGGDVFLSVGNGAAPGRQITVKIPPGITDGKTIRLRGQGERIPGSQPPGDLLVTVHVASHPHFQRRGNDLEVKVPISLREAIDGARVDIPAPRGTITLTIPPHSSSGRRLRVRGHGIRDRNGVTGDLLAEVQIMLPDPVDPELADAIRSHTRGETGKLRSKLTW